MKRTWRTCLFFLTLLISCGKYTDFQSPGAAGFFQATVNNETQLYSIESAVLVRTVDPNEKRLYIRAVSADTSKRISIILIEPTNEGVSVSRKNYIIRESNADDPGTSIDESINSADGYVAYSTNNGGQWTTDNYIQNGEVTVTATNDISLRVSGTFQLTLTSLSGAGTLTITNGKFLNVQYILTN